MFKRSCIGIVAVIMGGFALGTPLFVSASGNCTQFCVNATPRADSSQNVVLVPGSLCDPSFELRIAGTPTADLTECRTLPSCPSGMISATPSVVRSFCTPENRAMLSADEQTASGWCSGYPSAFAAGVCYVQPTSGARELPSVADSRVVAATPIPAPAHPGDAFRCRFMCSGDTQARDGGTCNAMDDLATCYRQCVTACGGSNSVPGGCVGVNNGGTLAPQGGVENQVPLCIPTQGATASIAGITDTQRFETVNEAFSTISIPNFIGGVVKAMLGIVGALFFGLLVWAGLQWMTAGGSSDDVHAAQKTVYNAVIGIAIIALSYTLVSVLIGVVANFAGAR